jgi:catechol 2,3-dioxygenase-like lactoylglutathione lyase family enzyme
VGIAGFADAARKETIVLNVEAINHIGIRVRDKRRSVSFYESLGFQWVKDVGFDQGHPVIVRHPCGVVLNLLGPADAADDSNILMDVEEKHPGYTHFALTVRSMSSAVQFMSDHGIEITGSFSFENMSAIFIRDPDRNVIEIDAYGDAEQADTDGYSAHPA